MTTYGLQPLVTIYHPPYSFDTKKEVWKHEIFKVVDSYLLIAHFPSGNRGMHDFMKFETAYEAATEKATE